MASDYSDDCSDDPSYEESDDSSDYMSDTLSLDLENEDDIINLKKTSDDPFLYKLCNQVSDELEPDVEFNMDEEDDDIGVQKIQKGVSYDPITGETMIGTSSGVPRPLWPNGIFPHSVSSLEDQFGHEVQEHPDIGDEGEVDGVHESQAVDKALTLD